MIEAERIEELEAKLAKAIDIAEVLSGCVEYDYHGNVCGEEEAIAIANLAGLYFQERDLRAMDRIEELGAKLADAMDIAEVLSGCVEYNYHGNVCGEDEAKAIANLAELKGETE